ncbi:CsbD family protein [Sandaracinobacteroides hominis]|uniref:CsbD family protein n=1 Tax=Sandaracinobacteroides hominis TaxID=2780086 RepID=UPI0018F40456|nr:CsbD family protein [Sandaracinobacteroides hominis]
MGEVKDRAKGLANEAAGNIKQGWGKLTDNPELEAEGIAQERKGEAQQVAGKVKGKMGNNI